MIVYTIVMPACKNNKTLKSKRMFTGKEPSPKGLGYCAHNEKLDKRMKGKDGKFWKVTRIANGTRRWKRISRTIKGNK